MYIKFDLIFSSLTVRAYSEAEKFDLKKENEAISRQ